MFLGLLLQGQQQAQDTFVQPLQNALSTFLSFLPQLLGAIVILIIGYIVAKVLESIVARVLRGIGFENWMERGGIRQFFDRAQTNRPPRASSASWCSGWCSSSRLRWPPTLWASRRCRRFWASS